MEEDSPDKLNFIKPRSSTLNPDIIEDVYIVSGNKIVLKLVNGETVTLPLTNELRNIYWAVKIRNRRKAFGL